MAIQTIGGSGGVLFVEPVASAVERTFSITAGTLPSTPNYIFKVRMLVMDNSTHVYSSSNAAGASHITYPSIEDVWVVTHAPGLTSFSTAATTSPAAAPTQTQTSTYRKVFKPIEFQCGPGAEIVLPVNVKPYQSFLAQINITYTYIGYMFT